MSTEEFDVVIAGAGAGGGFAAMALTEAGLRVLVLERGGRFDFTRDYPLRHRDWEDHPDVLKGTTLREDSIQATVGAPIAPRDRDLCSSGLGAPGRVDGTYRRRGTFNYRRVQGVGGSTLHYQGEAHRFPPHAFSARTIHGWGENWPIDYRELAPFYEKAERVLGVAGNPGNPFKARRGPFPTPAHELTTRSQLIRRGADKLGWSLLPNTLALPTASVDGRSPCRNTGGCGLGCPFGAKSSTDLAAVVRAERTGLLTLRTGARLVNVETDARGNVSGFVYRHGGDLQRATGRRYILALGAVETPRLLLASQTAAHPLGIGNDHEQVGRYFMETVVALLQVQAPFPVRSYQGPPLDARIWDFSAPDPGGAVRTGFILGPGGGLEGNGPLAFAESIGGFGLDHKERMREEYGTRFTLTGIAEQEPRWENYLRLGSEHDEEDVPMVIVESDFSALDKAALREVIARCRMLADAAGVKVLDRLFSSYSHSYAVHVAGGCRMGRHRASSVTDSFGRVHGVKNLYIADASTLVTQGAGDSPSLTIQALALRLADHLVAGRG